jgi:hypothetical protein
MVLTDMPPSPCQCSYPDWGKDKTPRWQKWVEITVAASTAGLLLINIFLWCATKQSADAAQRSIDTTVRQFHLEQRAWVSVEVAPRMTPKENDPIIVPLKIINYGKTPAERPHGWVDVTTVNISDEPKIGQSSKNPSAPFQAGMLFPNQQTPLDAPMLSPEGHGKGVPFSKNMLKAFDAQGVFFMTFGRIDYQDVFECQHWIQFCFTSNTKSERISEMERQCVKYNQIDHNEK